MDLPFVRRKMAKAKRIIRILIAELSTHADFSVAILAGAVVKMTAIVLS